MHRSALEHDTGVQVVCVVKWACTQEALKERKCPQTNSEAHLQNAINNMRVEHSNNNTRVQKKNEMYVYAILINVPANIGGFRNFSEAPQIWCYCIDVGKTQSLEDMLQFW
jgi:hypothetical protein